MSDFATALFTSFPPAVLGYMLNALWQVPLVFVAAWAAAGVARQAGPKMEHRVWVGALLLEVALPACHFQMGEMARRAWDLLLVLWPGDATSGQTRIVLGAGVASHLPLPLYAAQCFVALIAVFGCSAILSAARLGWGLWTTEKVRRGAKFFELNSNAARDAARLQAYMGMGNRLVSFACSRAISGPATVGVVGPTLLLPSGFLDKLSDADRDALLAHEFAHMQRGDFAKNLLYGLLSLPIACHPLLWLTRGRLAETRELVCDAMAAEAMGGKETYARALLRLASLLANRRTPKILHAIGILDANIFERRVMNLTSKHLEPGTARRLVVVAACMLLTVATCGTALALRMDVNQTPPSKNHAPISVKSTSMTLVNKAVPVYPVEAKKARVTGTVVLDAVIGKDGSVENLRVVKGPSMLQQSALDAVRQWRYQPYLLNGDPVEVKTSINIMYSLSK
jgi:TonB family protein